MQTLAERQVPVGVAAAGIRAGSAVTAAQRPGCSSRRRTVLPIRPVVVSCPANESENRMEPISSKVSRSGDSRWMAIRSLVRSSPGLTGSAAAVAGFLVSNLVPALDPGAIAVCVGVVLPACLGVAILKYRLYDIDRIISRTLAYAIVTGLLVGLYTGLVLLTTEVFRVHTPVAVAVSTLAAAAPFNPLRRRVQRVVDRRFNRARYDADQTVAAFAARLKDAVDLDSVRDDLAGVAHHALEPAHVSMWISHRD